MQWPASLLSRSPEDTRELGLRLGRQLPRGAVLALQGLLGTGKTTLVKGIAAALGVPDAVTSPSFTLVSQYEGRRPDGPLALYHIDLYRLGEERELASIGLEDILAAAGSGGLAVIEWAERAASLLGEEGLRERTMWVRIELQSDGARRIRIQAAEPPAA